jgi:hypothetical protein
MTDAAIIRDMLKNAEYFDSEEGADKYVEANAALDRLLSELERLRDWHGSDEADDPGQPQEKM